MKKAYAPEPGARGRAAPGLLAAPGPAAPGPAAAGPAARERAASEAAPGPAAPGPVVGEHVGRKTALGAPDRPRALDDTDRRLVNTLQGGFPLVERPYAAVGEALGLAEDEVIARVQRLLDTRVLTRFGPMFHAERLGGAFCLAAMAVPEEDWPRVVESVNAFPEVAHNYRREHALNMWFVLATETPGAVEEVASRIQAATGLPVLCFPKEREFFVGMRLEA